MGFYDTMTDRIAGLFSGGSLGAILLDSSYTFDPTHEYLSDIISAQAEDSDLATLTGLDVSVGTNDDDILTLSVKCDPIDFGNFLLTSAVGVAFYREDVDPASAELISFDLFDSEESSGSAQDIIYDPPEDGIVVFYLS